MRRKRVAIAGLGVVLVVLVLLVIWSSLRPKPPEPARQEVSSQSSAEGEREAPRIQPPQNEAAGEAREAPVSGKANRKGKTAAFASASWAMEQQRIGPEGLVKESSVSRIWIKGDKKRVETFRTLGAWSGTSLQPAIIVFSDRDYVHAYYPERKRMFRFPRRFSLEVLAEKWTKKKSEVKIGTEVIDGKACDVYRVVNDVNVGGLATVPMEVKESRWQGLVLKEVSRTIGSSTADILTTQLRDVQLDVAIPDEKFTLPPGVPIEDAKIPSEEALQKTFR